MSTRPIVTAIQILSLRPLEFAGIWLVVLPALLIERSLVGMADDQLHWAVLMGGVLTHAIFFLFSLQVATGATLLQVLAIRKGEPLSLGDALRGALAQSLPFLKASGILAIAIVLGIIAFVLPAMIVITLYSFVPFFILTSPPLPLMAYFDRSLKLARRRFFWLFVGTALSLVLANTADFLGPLVGVHGAAAIVLSCGLAYVVNIVTQVWLACNFILLKGDSPS